MPAKGPPLETRGIAEQENLPFFRLHLEIVMAQSFWVYPSLIPPVQDFHDLVSLSQMNKSPGALLPFVAAVRFHFNVFKDPVFFHFIFTAEIAEPAETD